MYLEPCRDIRNIDATIWDSLIPDQNPFTCHAFLAALEQSGSVGPETGWDIFHLILYDDDKTIRAIMPAYLKSHSYGEYIFDHSWAHGYERAGGQYYPKLLSAVPFTPVPGGRILARQNDDEARTALIHAAAQLTEKLSLSSMHVNFISQQDKDSFAASHWQIREGLQFHWHNQDYQSFDDFLGALSSRKRKNIRKERASLVAHNIQFLRVSGQDITAAHWDYFYEFYLATIEKKWGGAYLTRGFFDEIGCTMADKIVLILAQRDRQIVAGALNLVNDECLFGRNWGSLVDIPNLHFETCYYQAIDYAIEHRLARVEAGAQGMHKVQRGYLPVRTYSAHHICHDGFRDAIERFLQSEQRAVSAECEQIMQYSPYKEREARL